MSGRSSMTCERCGCFSSTRVCWNCSNLPDAVQYGLLELTKRERDDYRKALEKIIAESDDAIAIELAHSAITPYTPWEPVNE